MKQNIQPLNVSLDRQHKGEVIFVSEVGVTLRAPHCSDIWSWQGNLLTRCPNVAHVNLPLKGHVNLEIFGLMHLNHAAGFLHSNSGVKMS